MFWKFLLISSVILLSSFHAAANNLSIIAQMTQRLPQGSNIESHIILYDNGELWSSSHGKQPRRERILKLSEEALRHLKQNIDAVDIKHGPTAHAIMPRTRVSELKIEVIRSGQMLTLLEDRAGKTYSYDAAFDTIDFMKQALSFVEAAQFLSFTEPGSRAPGSQ